MPDAKKMASMFCLTFSCPSTHHEQVSSLSGSPVLLLGQRDVFRMRGCSNHGTRPAIHQLAYSNGRECNRPSDFTRNCLDLNRLTNVRSPNVRNVDIDGCASFLEPMGGNRQATTPINKSCADGSMDGSSGVDMILAKRQTRRDGSLCGRDYIDG